MASSERPALAGLLARSGPLPPATWTTPEDLGRASVEAMVAAAEGSPRGMPSRGRLRFWGDLSDDNRADLDRFGAIISAWQRTLSAVGASLEGIRSARGSLPRDLTHRTTLVVTSSPGAGSVVLLIEAKSEPLE